MELSRQQCDNIKGYAILLIVVHNFVDHLLGIHCNEMAYSQANTDAFLSGVFSSAAVWQLFSFAGWVGVVMFLFLSGYGLMRKYGTAPTPRKAMATACSGLSALFCHLSLRVSTGSQLAVGHRPANIHHQPA